jgi:hypothetical protein
MIEVVRYGGLLILIFCQRLSPPNAPYKIAVPCSLFPTSARSLMIEVVRYGGLLILVFCQRLSPPNAPYKLAIALDFVPATQRARTGVRSQKSFPNPKSKIQNPKLP